MRVTCPACGARYAVDDGAIPAGGRMVQCSACQAEWRAQRQPAPGALAAPAIAQAESAQAESAQAESAQAESAQAESAQAESAQAESAQAAGPQAAGPQAAGARPVAAPADPPVRPQPAAMIASLENDATPARRGGFFTGFIVVALLALAAVTLYAKHAAIATAAPAAAEPLGAYVAAVDQGRAWLAETVARLRDGG